MKTLKNISRKTLVAGKAALTAGKTALAVGALAGTLTFSSCTPSPKQIKAQWENLQQKPNLSPEEIKTFIVPLQELSSGIHPSDKNYNFLIELNKTINTKYGEVLYNEYLSIKDNPDITAEQLEDILFKDEQRLYEGNVNKSEY
jgi:hypothetical protein